MRWEFDSMTEGYPEVCEDLLRKGQKVSPRGMNTVEIEDATIVLRDPTKPFPHGIGRKYGAAIAVAEGLCLAGGIADPQLMLSVGSNFARFLDGGNLHGAYGPRVRAQLPEVERKLKEDRDTRQAVLQVWDARYDQGGWTPKDLPCTLMLGFSIRGGKLNMRTTMRSNDVWWGLAHDVPMFTLLQLTMANALHLEPGTYTHHDWSLHFYERDFTGFDVMHPYDGRELPPWVGLECMDAGIVGGMDRARDIAGGGIPTDPNETELWCWNTVAHHAAVARESRELAKRGPAPPA